jgi:hypothetical protein
MRFPDIYRIAAGRVATRTALRALGALLITRTWRLLTARGLTLHMRLMSLTNLARLTCLGTLMSLTAAVKSAAQRRLAIPRIPTNMTMACCSMTCSLNARASVLYTRLEWRDGPGIDDEPEVR